MIAILAARELRSLFFSPLAWIILTVTQSILAWVFIILVEDFKNLQGRLMGVENAPGVIDIVAAPLFQAAAWLLLLLVPLLTMRLFSEERRQHTLDLLLSAPISPMVIVLGKYFGAVIFLLIAIMLIALMPLSLATGTSLDYGKLLAGLLGLVLIVSSFAAAGLYLSMLTTQPGTAATATFGLLLLLWMADAASTSPNLTGQLLGYLSPMHHYDALLRGLFNSADIAYYLLFCTVFLGLAIRRLDDFRLQD